MRSVITASVILILIIITITAANIYATVTAENVVRDIDSLKAAIESSDWKKSTLCYGEMQKYWDKNKPLFEVLFEHDEIDLVQTSFVRLEKMIKLAMYKEALIEATVVKMLMEHLPRRDCLTPSNVF